MSLRILLTTVPKQKEEHYQKNLEIGKVFQKRSSFSKTKPNHSFIISALKCSFSDPNLKNVRTKVDLS